VAAAQLGRVVSPVVATARLGLLGNLPRPAAGVTADTRSYPSRSRCWWPRYRRWLLRGRSSPRAGDVTAGIHKQNRLRGCGRKLDCCRDHCFHQSHYLPMTPETPSRSASCSSPCDERPSWNGSRPTTSGHSPGADAVRDGQRPTYYGAALMASAFSGTERNKY